MQVLYGGDELAQEGTRLLLAQPRILLTLDVRLELSTSRVLRHQAVQRGGLKHTHRSYSTLPGCRNIVSILHLTATPPPHRNTRRAGTGLRSEVSLT